MRVRGGGLAIDLQPEPRPCVPAQHEVQVPTDTDPSHVSIAADVVLLVRVDPSSATVLRRVVAVQDLANCGPGRYTLNVSAVVRADQPSPERRLTAKAALVVVP